MNTITHTVSLHQPNFQRLSLDEISERIWQVLKTANLEKKDELAGLISQVRPHELRQVLDRAFEKFSKEFTGDRDLISAIDKLAEMLPYEKLERAIPSQNEPPLDALQTGKDMLEEGNYYLSKIENKGPSTFDRTITIISDFLIAIAETIIQALGVRDLFEPAEDDYHAQMKIHKITMLSTFFAFLTASLLPLAGEVMAGYIIGGALLFISALSLVYPYIKAAPLFLPEGENWTRKMLIGELKAPGGRKETLDRIANALITNSSGRNHPLLIGPAGVGKTETAKAFVEAILRGDYPELKGKQVFYFNTANLVNYSEKFGKRNTILQKIIEAMGPHQDNTILIFDEIHLACQKKEKGTSSPIGEQLKTLLQSGKLPNVIGITTQEEFYRDIVSNNEAFADRFEKIVIENTDRNETLEILNATLLKQAPHVILEEGAFEHLLDKSEEVFSKEQAQPGSALKILAKCIQKTSKSQKSQLEKKIEKIEAEIKSLYSQGAVQQSSRKPALQENRRIESVRNLQKELKALEKDLQQEKIKQKSFFQARDRLLEIKAEMFRSALKISALKPNALTASDKSDIVRFLALRFFALPSFQNHVKSQANELGIQTVIDSMLIDQVVKEKQENDKKVQLAMTKGKKRTKRK